MSLDAFLRSGVVSFFIERGLVTASLLFSFRFYSDSDQ